jgi:hypothetical protein
VWYPSRKPLLGESFQTQPAQPVLDIRGVGLPGHQLTNAATIELLRRLVSPPVGVLMIDSPSRVRSMRSSRLETHSRFSASSVSGASGEPSSVSVSIVSPLLLHRMRFDVAFPTQDNERRRALPRSRDED